jgi:large subunit ribosomal protein L6
MKYIENFFFTDIIQIPSNVKIQKIKSSLHFEGPLGLIEIDISKIDSFGLGFFRMKTELNQFEVFVQKTSKNSKSFFGSLTSLFRNNIHGVCQGYLVYLELTGVGFRAIIHEMNSFQKIELKIGQSHEIMYSMPVNIRAFSVKPTLLCLYGLDKIQINKIASEIRDFRPPEPYKGKGIRYKDELIQIKVGKKK